MECKYEKPTKKENEMKEKLSESEFSSLVGKS